MPGYEGTYFFLSDEETGTGSEQTIPHDLGCIPHHVIAFLTGGPSSYSQPSIDGDTNAENLYFTVTTGWKYRVLAYA